MKKDLCTLIFLLTFFVTSSFSQKVDNKNILWDIYRSTNGEGWFQTWDFGKGLCNQFGVTCNSTGHVTALTLSSNNLRGTIPSSISFLSLFRLELANNHLFGTIPKVFPLNILYLKGNSFDCPIENYSTWSKVTDYSFYSSSINNSSSSSSSSNDNNVNCKGLFCVVNSGTGKNECLNKTTRYIESELEMNSNFWNRPSLRGDSTCCFSPTNLSYPFYRYSFIVTNDGFYELSLSSFDSFDSDSYLFLFKNFESNNNFELNEIIVANDDQSSNNYLSKLKVYLQKDKHFTLIVTTFSPNSFGNFVLQIKGPFGFDLFPTCKQEIFMNASFPNSQGGHDILGTCLQGFTLLDHTTPILRKCLPNGEWSSSLLSGKCVNNNHFDQFDVNLLLDSFRNVTETLSHLKLDFDQLTYQVNYLSKLREYLRFKLTGQFSTGTAGLEKVFPILDKLFAIHDSLIKVYNRYDLTQPPYVLGLGIAGDFNYGFVTKEGDLLIPDGIKNCIWIIKKENPFLLEIFMGPETGILHPLSIIIDNDDRIIVSEHGRSSITFFTPQFQKLYSLSGYKAHQTAFSPVTKELYLCDANGRIVIFKKDSNGNYYQSQVRNKGFIVRTILLDYYGNYILNDLENNRYMIYEQDGTFVSSFGASNALSITEIEEETYIATDYVNGIMKYFSTKKQL